MAATVSAAAFRRSVTSERQLQAAVLNCIKLRAFRTVYAFAIPNEAKRSPQLAARMIKQGLRPGVADLCIMQTGGRTGWLELKSAKGKQSPAQKHFQNICSTLGHRYAVAHTLDEALDTLKQWGAL
jgi:hypothetical protein